MLVDTGQVKWHQPLLELFVARCVIHVPNHLASLLKENLCCQNECQHYWTGRCSLYML